jgi:hypothetical protein
VAGLKKNTSASTAPTPKAANTHISCRDGFISNATRN